MPGPVIVESSTSAQLCNGAGFGELDQACNHAYEHSVFRVQHARTCNLDVAHEKSGQPVLGTAQLLASVELPNLSICA